MSRATQALHASAEKWLPKNTQQQLYWVLLVSGVLLLGIQTSKWLQRAPDESPATVAAATTDTVEPAPATDAIVGVSATAAPNANDDVVVVDSVTVAVDDAADSPLMDDNDAEQGVANSERDPALDQQVTQSADQDVVVRVFAALGSPGQAAVTEPAPPSVSGPADLPEFFTAITRYAAQSQETAEERESRRQRVAYLFTLHAPPTSNSTAEFLARQLSNHRNEPSSQETAPVTSDAQPSTVATTSEEPATLTANAVANPEAGASSPDSDAAAAETAANLASRAHTSASPADNQEVLPTAELVLVNPAENGGTILFLVEGQVFSLAPGQSHRLPADRPRRVAFHRGDDFGDADILLTAGEFNFAVGPQGWQLLPANAAP